MKNILVTGINGQLGHDVVKELDRRGYNAIGADRSIIDLTDSEAIRNCIYSNDLDGIIHCAAYTAVDKAEDDISICEYVNALAVKEIAMCAKNLDIPMVHISTDYVFDGSKEGEYTEEDIPCPINIYGKSKFDGEEYIRNILSKYFIVRISWVFGENGNNFIDTMLRLSKERSELSIINDQIGSPTYTKDVAPLLVDMIDSDKYGTYHATNEGFCSWYDFARKIFELKNININLNPILTKEYPTRAKRPLNSKMSKLKLSESGFRRLRHWEEALKDYLQK